MNCIKVLELYHSTDHQDMPLYMRIRLGLHLIACPACTRKVERFEQCKEILSADFFPPSPGLEDSVMAIVIAEEGKPLEAELSGGFSTRGWVIAGLVMLVSLASAFFGLDFNKVALEAGISFMVPIGITIGIALTCYGALFIGCHLKEFSERFGL